MTRPLLPPRGVFVPAAILYDKNLSPAARDTWSQLRGLAWGQSETPPLSISQLIDMLGKSQSTLYGHMTTLRARGALRWRSAGDGTLIVSFPESLSEDPAFQDSEKLESPILLTPHEESKDPNADLKRESGFQNSGILETRKTGKQAKKPRDPLLDHPAVQVYKGVMHLTANESQRRLIVDQVQDVDAWRGALEHWKSHGWNPKNVPGLLQLYGRGGASACEFCAGTKNGRAGAGPKTTEPKSLNAVRKFAERHGVTLDGEA